MRTPDPESLDLYPLRIIPRYVKRIVRRRPEDDGPPGDPDQSRDRDGEEKRAFGHRILSFTPGNNPLDRVRISQLRCRCTTYTANHQRVLLPSHCNEDMSWPHANRHRSKHHHRVKRGFRAQSQTDYRLRSAGSQEYPIHEGQAHEAPGKK